jgi:hypothetical protein
MESGRRDSEIRGGKAFPDSEVETTVSRPEHCTRDQRGLPPHTPVVVTRRSAGCPRRVEISNLPAAGVLAVAVQFRHRSRALAVVSTVLAARSCETTAALVGAFAIRVLLCHDVLLRRAKPTAPERHATVGPATARPFARWSAPRPRPARHPSTRRCATASSTSALLTCVLPFDCYTGGLAYRNLWS